MQSSGAMSGCGVGTSSEVLMHCSDEGVQSVDPDEDSKMKSQRSNADDQSSSLVLEEEEPKNDF